MTKYAKLVMVAVGQGSAAQSNKYYEMVWDGVSSNFTATYGRVESTAANATYPVYQWDKKYNEKIKKGYKDVTAFVSLDKGASKSQPQQKMASIADMDVDSFMNLMKKYRDNLVTQVYSVKATSVTQAQVDEAQKIIDRLNGNGAKVPNIAAINQLLTELYMVIPRYMGKVQDHLLPKLDLAKALVQEQDNLDAMASQVGQVTKAKKVAVPKAQTLLDALGITMEKMDKVPKDLEYLHKQLSTSKIKGLFRVSSKSQDAAFDTWLSKQKDKNTSILLHGTRCTSVLPILEQGLKIRPSGNYQFSGKAYGEGNYFSEMCQKSLGYTGYDNDQVLLVYEVHTGNPFKYNGWYTGNSFTLCYKELSSRGYDTTYVAAGNRLLNSEIIAYKEEQSRPKYIIHLKR